MQTVNTVTGPVKTSELGRTLMHEHLFTLYPELRTQYQWDEEEKVTYAVSEMKELRARGVRTLVDMTTYGLGRYIPRVRRVAEESGIQILVATGLYTFYDYPQFFLAGLINEGPNFVVDFFVNEICNGISDTGVKPAVLKCATGKNGVMADVEAILRATARAHRQTGIPIATHTDSMTCHGLAQQKIFREEGVDLTRVMIGHVGDSTDLDYIEELLSHGSLVGMDRFGAHRLCPLNDRIATVAALCKKGYVDQVVISMDTTVESDNLSLKRRASVPGYLQDRRHVYLPDVVVPALLEAGISQAEIDKMMIDTPRRFFEKTGAY